MNAIMFGFCSVVEAVGMQQLCSMAFAWSRICSSLIGQWSLSRAQIRHQDDRRRDVEAVPSLVSKSPLKGKAHVLVPFGKASVPSRHQTGM